MIRALAGLSALALLAGTTGAVWPWGDSLAVGRIPTVAVLALSAMWILCRGSRRLGLLLAGLALIGALSTVAPWSAPPAKAITLYSKNLLYDLQNYEPLAQDIRRTAPDLVALQEVRPDHPLLATLATDYPYQAECRTPGYRETAVLSRRPFVTSPLCLRGQTAAQVDSPFGPLWVVSLHLYWPAPYNQSKLADLLVNEFQVLNGPVVLAGDFNMVPWASVPRRLRRATNTIWQGRPKGTLPLAHILRRDWPLWPALPIDHVFVPKGWDLRTETRPALGADHFGLLAHFGTR